MLCKRLWGTGQYFYCATVLDNYPSMICWIFLTQPWQLPWISRDTLKWQSLGQSPRPKLKISNTTTDHRTSLNWPRRWRPGWPSPAWAGQSWSCTASCLAPSPPSCTQSPKTPAGQNSTLPLPPKKTQQQQQKHTTTNKQKESVVHNHISGSFIKVLTQAKTYSPSLPHPVFSANFSVTSKIPLRSWSNMYTAINKSHSKQINKQKQGWERLGEGLNVHGSLLPRQWEQSAKYV